MYERIYEWDNLLSAYRKAKKCKSSNVIDEFNYYWESELLDIQSKLMNQEYVFGAYHRFMIYEPKERLIMAAPFRDRVVHHAICNILGSILDKTLIIDSYACRNGKGLHRALKRAFYMYRNSRYHYRLDISKFYYTIDHDILMDLLMRKIKDQKLLSLIRDLLNTYDSGMQYYDPYEGDDLIDMIRSRGLPIGNLTSQVFANYYLSSFDHYVREHLHQSRYVRYMDDIVVFADTQEALHESQREMLGFLQQIKLKPNPNKNFIRSNGQGLNFLGFRLVANQIKICNANLRRFKRKLIAKSKVKNIDLKVLLQSFNGHLGFLLGGHTKRVINNVLDDFEFTCNYRKCKLIVC